MGSLPTGSSVGGLYINGALGVDLVSMLTKYETAVQGFFVIEQGEAQQDVSDAIFTVNGNGVPPTSLGYFDLGALPGLRVAPGSRIVFTARRGTEMATLEVPCPSDVVLTTPADGTIVSPGQSITVAWSGKIDYQGPLSGVAELWIREYSFAQNELAYTNDPAPQELDTAQSSIVVTVPAMHSSSSFDGYMVELVVPGLRALNDGGDTVCELRKRVRIKTP